MSLPLFLIFLLFLTESIFKPQMPPALHGAGSLLFYYSESVLYSGRSFQEWSVLPEKGSFVGPLIPDSMIS
jgi:hypothetical protein